jgi:hypothetical protein
LENRYENLKLIMILIIYIKNHYSYWPKGMQLKDSAWKEMRWQEKCSGKMKYVAKAKPKDISI